MKKKALWKKIILGIVGVVLALGLAFFVWILILTATEYNPEEIENVTINGKYSKTLAEGDTISLLSWNIGYAALGDNADFFMDGGSHVMTSSVERVQENLETIADTVAELSPDIVFFQEVDEDSKRTYSIDEAQTLIGDFSGYQNAFAINYKCLYVPYPIPTIGKVNSGILTLSRFETTSAERRKLPCPFSWPVRVANLKRGLLVERIPIQNSEKELVIINLHLEAYDDGEGKEAQTAVLKELLESEMAAGNYVIAGGDFNQTFSNTDTESYPQVSEDLWQPGRIDVSDFSEELQFIADSATPTCRSLDQPYVEADRDNFQYYMTDGYIVSSNIKVESAETLDKEFVSADHNPVLLSVTLLDEK
jgi:endonuclease/exonuclease/phosphatase family metal-dependent hydrolase